MPDHLLRAVDRLVIEAIRVEGLACLFVDHCLVVLSGATASAIAFLTHLGLTRAGLAGLSWHGLGWPGTPGLAQAGLVGLG